MKYKQAWINFVDRFGGAVDGLESASEEGYSEAIRECKIYREIQELIDEVAKENNVEKVWYK